MKPPKRAKVIAPGSMPLGRWLAVQRRWTWATAGALGLVLLVTLLVRAPWSTSHWPSTTRQVVTVTAVDDAGRLRVRRSNWPADRTEPVDLLGIQIRSADRDWLADRVVGREVVLEFAQPHALPRAAYVYLADGVMLNQALLTEGRARHATAAAHPLIDDFAARMRKADKAGQ